MAKKQKVIVTGIMEIDRALKQVEAKTQKKIVRRSMRNSMKKEVLAEARAKSPVDSGLMKSQIKVRAGNAKRGDIAVVVQVGDKKFNNFYPKFVEFGTTNIAAREFMRKAYQAKDEKASKQVQVEIVHEIEKEVKRQNKS